jgi:hypothetical protein
VLGTRPICFARERTVGRRVPGASEPLSMAARICARSCAYGGSADERSMRTRRLSVRVSMASR